MPPCKVAFICTHIQQKSKNNLAQSDNNPVIIFFLLSNKSFTEMILSLGISDLLCKFVYMCTHFTQQNSK